MKNVLSYSEWAKNNPDLVTPKEVPVSTHPQEPVNTAPVEAPVPAEAPVPTMDFQTPTGAPQARIEQSRNEITNTTQDMANSQLRQAEHKAQGHEALAAALKESEDKARKIALETETQVGANDEEQKRLHEKHTELTNKLFEPPVEPKAWQRTVKVLGDILSVAAQGWLGPAGNVIGVAMSAIDHAVSKNVYRQLDEKEGAKENIGLVKELLEGAAKEDSDHIRNGHALIGLNYLATSKQIERLAEAAKTPEEREAGLQLALATRERFFQLNDKWAHEDQTRQDQLRAQQQSDAAARARALAQAPDWSRMPIAQLEALEASGQAPASLHEYLTRLKNADRAAAGSSGESTAQDIPGYNRIKDVSPAQVTKANTALASANLLNSTLDRLEQLRQLATREGVTQSERNAYEVEAQGLIGNYADTESQLVGGGQAGEAAKEAALKNMPSPTRWDATVALGGADPSAVYRALKQNNKRRANEVLRSLGYEPTAAPEAPPDSPPDLAPRPNSAPPTIEQHRQAAETRRREQYSEYIRRQGKKSG